VRLLDAVLGRTSASAEEAERPMSLTIRAGEHLIDTDWMDWKVSNDGESEWRGFQPIDVKTSIWIFGDELPEPIAKAGCWLCPVAGISNYSGRVISDFAPGQEVRLVREPSNRHDRNAVSVRSLDGGVVAGYVPRAVAKRIAPQMDQGVTFRAVVLWELRRAGSRGRDGMRVFLGPGLGLDTMPRGGM
jgi:hypothetical protein